MTLEELPQETKEDFEKTLECSNGENCGGRVLMPYNSTSRKVLIECPKCGVGYRNPTDEEIKGHYGSVREFNRFRKIPMDI